MKPLHIVLLVGAGALGGVMLTNSLQRSPQAAPASAAALAPAPESVLPAMPTPLTGEALAGPGATGPKRCRAPAKAGTRRESARSPSAG